MSKPKVVLMIPDAALPLLLNDMNQFRLEQLLASGAHCEFWKGFDTKNNKAVLVRRALKDRPSMKSINGFKATLSVLSRVKNPFILEMLGFAQERLAIVFDGVNDTLLRVHANDGKFLSGTNLTVIAVAIACAMEALSRHGYVVRDLRPDRVYLKADNEPRIACFDHAHTMDESSPPLRAKPKVWDSPELLSNMPYDRKTDVYSYGMLLLFMATKKVPYAKKTGAEIRDRIVDGKRPSIPRKVPGKLAKMIAACWNQDPARRPEWDTIIQAWLYDGVEFSGTNRAQVTLFSQKIIDAQKIPVGDPISYEIMEDTEKQRWVRGIDTLESVKGRDDEWSSEEEESRAPPRVFSSLTLATAGKKRSPLPVVKAERRKTDVSSSDDERHSRKRSRETARKRKRSSEDETVSRKVQKRKISIDDESVPRRQARRVLSSDEEDERPRKRTRRITLSSDDDEARAPRRRPVLSSDDSDNRSPRKRPVLSSDDSDNRSPRKRPVLSSEDDMPVRRYSFHEPASPKRSIMLRRSVSVNLSVIANITHPKWEQEMMKAKQGLKPDQYRAFFEIISDYMRLRTDTDKLSLIMDVLASVCCDERAVRSLAEVGIQRVLPVDDPILIDETLNVLDSLFKTRADLFQDNFQHQMAMIIARRPERSLQLLHSYARQFQLIENPWPIVDLFLRNYKVFLKSNSSAEFIRIFSYMNTKYTAFVKARVDVSRWVFERLLRSDDKSTVVEAYRALTDVCDSGYKAPVQTIIQDIKDPILASSALSLLLKCEQFPVSKEIIHTLINASLENASATKVIISVLDLDGVIDILLESPKWMCYPLPTFTWTLKLVSQLARYKGVDEDLAAMPETLTMANAVVCDGDSDAVQALGDVLASISFSNVKSLDDVDFFASLHERTVHEDDATPYLKLLASLANLGYSLSFLSFIPLLRKSLSIDELRHAGLSALVSLSAHKKCAAEMVKQKIHTEVRKHCTDSRDRSRAKRLLSSLSCL